MASRLVRALAITAVLLLGAVQAGAQSPTPTTAPTTRPRTPAPTRKPTAKPTTRPRVTATPSPTPTPAPSPTPRVEIRDVVHTKEKKVGRFWGFFGLVVGGLIGRASWVWQRRLRAGRH
jgi:outer membrane biosynthesis protein TonB